MEKLVLLVLCVSFPCVQPQSKPLRERRSDDHDPLEAVVGTQAAAIQQVLQSQIAAIQASVQANTQRNSKNAAFTVRFSGDQVQVAPKQVFRFDNVLLNDGNGYNVQSGIFTAPSRGTYFFMFNFMITNDETYMQVVIDNSGTTLAKAHADSNHGKLWDKGSAHATVHLNAGDEVWVRHNNGNGNHIYGGLWTSFTGFLLHAD